MLKSVLLSHDLPITEHHGEKLPSASKDRSLEEAICLFERILQANGKIDGGEDDMDRSEQFQHIEAEARRLSILYDGLEPHVQGGREHDLTHDGESATVLKFTKPSSAAYVVMFLEGKPRLIPGDPAEYLARLLLHNEVFGEFTTFVGIGGLPCNRRIITRQLQVIGRPAEWDEIDTLMITDLGFLKLRHNHGIGHEVSCA